MLCIDDSIFQMSFEKCINVDEFSTEYFIYQSKIKLAGKFFRTKRHFHGIMYIIVYVILYSSLFFLQLSKDDQFKSVYIHYDDG